MSEKIKIICVVGPTASGKTGLGVGIAEALGGEVISADSMQIYRDMHIASAAPDSRETHGIPHHLVEFLPYGESFTVAQYVAAARDKIQEIHSRGRLPIIVGGTGLYINSLVDNIEFVPQEDNLELRARLTALCKQIGAEAMLERLYALDPEAAEKLNTGDTRRIIRAFEIYEATGLTPSEHNRRSRSNESPYAPIMIGISFSDRQKLYERINLRVDKMLENGLIDEARAAYLKRSSGKSGAVQAIGHKELFDYFDGNQSLEEAVELLKRSTRRYAKRQLTWFGRDTRINWIYRDETADSLAQALKIIEREG